MLRLLFVTVLAVSGIFAACPNYNANTWIAAVGTNCYTSKVYTANLTNNDYCYDSINYSLQTHVTLANAVATRQSDSIGDVQMGTKNCGLNETNIKYCDSHCADKNVENALVWSAMQISGNYDSIWSAAKQKMTKLGKSDWPILMIEPFEMHSEVDFQYYDDMNYCMIDVTYVLPAGDYYPSWPFRTFFLTHKTVPQK